MRILGISLALLNLLLWWSVPAIGPFIDSKTGRWSNPNNPQIMTGVQELLVYFDPWLARRVFPVIFILGFACIPFLRSSSRTHAETSPGWIYTAVLSTLLISLEGVWLLLIFVGVVLRGPNWNIFWPGEEWDAFKIVPLNNVNLSDLFWLNLGYPLPETWAWREMPGLLFLGSYFLVGVALAYVCFRKGHRLTPFWRWAALVLLLQLAGLVPIKMGLRWLFNVKYLVFDPAFVWNV